MLVVITVAVFLVLFVRLAYLQVIEGEELRRLSVNNCIRLQDLDPHRGLIYDQHGTLLVDNRPAFDLSIIPKDAKPVHQTLAKLAGYTGLPLNELKSKITRRKRRASYKPITLKQDIGREMLAAIEVHKFDLPGVVVHVKPRRHYIDAQSASHLLGYLSEISGDELKSGQYPGCRPGDFIGKFGVERTYENYLRGGHGGRQVEVDATGRVVRVMKTVDSRAGNNIYLTLDQRVQKVAEKSLIGKAGAAVAIDPNSGRVLALASSPSFDQNIFVDGLSADAWKVLVEHPEHPMENKAIQGQYPPASTYKIITAIAGLEDGAVDETTTYHCPGYYTFGDRTFRCWKKGGHGKMDMVRAIAESCDVYFYQVGQKVGVDRIAYWASAYGLGQRTGIAIGQENRGLVPTSEWKLRRYGIPWLQGETLSIAIGQGYNLVTPLQMAVLISAIGNGGTRYRPLILETIKTAEGVTVHEESPVVSGTVTISPETLELVRKGLFEVVQTRHGTAYWSRLKNIPISGKTGTAQLVSRTTDEEKTEEEEEEPIKDHAWFVAYAPSEDPRIAVSVIVEHGEHGSSAAAPIARDMIRAYLENPIATQRQTPQRNAESGG